MRTIGSRIGSRTTLFALAFVLVGGIAMGGAKIPPVIGDLNGTAWNVKVSGTGHDLGRWAGEKVKDTGYWEMTQTGASTIHIEHHDLVEGITFDGYYEGGTLAISTVSQNSLADVAVGGHLVISGTPGKFKFQGFIVLYDLPTLDLAFYGTVSGSQDTGNGIADADDLTAAGPLDAVTGGTPPPAPDIDDILGDWAVSDAYTTYVFGQSKATKGKDAPTFTVSQLADDVVELIWHSGSNNWLYHGYYIEGVVIVGLGNSALSPSDWVEVMYLRFTGVPGRMQLAGQYVWVNLPEFIEYDTLSGRKVQ
jgi:hypothetical protein